MAALRIHPPSRALPLLAVLAAMLSLLLGASSVAAAPGDCVLRVAVSPAPGDEGSTSITVEPDIELTLWGSFIPDARIDLTFTWDGTPFGDYTPGTADAEGDFLFVHSFPPSQIGLWTVTAAVAETECAGTVEITVVAATGSPSPTPSASTIAPAPSASALPNTAVTADSATAPPNLGGVVALLMVLGGAGIAVLVRGVGRR